MWNKRISTMKQNTLYNQINYVNNWNYQFSNEYLNTIDNTIHNNKQFAQSLIKISTYTIHIV